MRSRTARYTGSKSGAVASKQLAGIEPARLQAARAVGLHEVGEGAVEEQRHMAEEVVEDVGLDRAVNSSDLLR